MASARTLTGVYILFALCLVLNVALWSLLRDKQVQWMNVPPVPSMTTAKGFGIGDPQLAYRNIGFMLQNLGDSGGKTRSLDEYDYESLAAWFRMENRLDPDSQFIPYLAAYYFSAVQKTEKLRPLIAYLEEVGKEGVDGKWRWLVQAIYLTRYKLEDMDWALRMATTLRLLHMQGVNMPVWAQNMDAMIMQVGGDKDAAYGIMLQTLQSEGDHMAPTEKYFILDQICNRILSPSEARTKSFCDAMIDAP